MVNAAVTVPNVLGLTSETAITKLQEQGLSVDKIKEQRSDRQTGHIIVQAPMAGKQVKEGYTVKLVVAIPLEKPKTTSTPNL